MNERGKVLSVDWEGARTRRDTCGEGQFGDELFFAETRFLLFLGAAVITVLRRSGGTSPSSTASQNSVSRSCRSSRSVRAWETMWIPTKLETAMRAASAASTESMRSPSARARSNSAVVALIHGA